MNDRKKRIQNTNMSEIGKLPPQAIELEEAVLGAVLLTDDAYHQVADMLVPDVFYKEQNGMVCAAIISLKNKGEKVDILTVTQELKRIGTLEKVGGAYYVSSLTNRIASGANIEYHMRIVLEMFIKRQAIMSGTAVIKNAYEDSTDAFEIVDEWEKYLNGITSMLFINKASDPIALHSKLLDHNDIITSSTASVIGVPTGFRELDLVTGGWQKTDLIILAARPGMGKTALAIQLAKNAAVAGKPAAIFSLEMSELQLYRRLCSQDTEIPLDKFTKTGLDENDLFLVDRDTKELRNAPLYIDDTGGQTIFDIRNKARKLKREKHIELIVIDYLQLITLNKSDRYSNREQEVGTISRALKALAKELDIPVIALSQLSRLVEDRSKSTDHIPKLSHLRDSGSIEQDADQVIFIYRPEYYGITQDSDGNSTKRVAKIIIAKNRNGALDDVDLKWVGTSTKFLDRNAPVKGELPEINHLEANADFLTN